MNVTDKKVTHENDVDAENEIPKTPMWLKVLVTVLGAAIVAMLLLIVFKIANGDHQTSDEQSIVQEQTLPGVDAGATRFPPIAVSVGDYSVPRPAGATLISMVPEGVELYMHFRLPNGDEQITILNRQTGAISTIMIQ